MNKNHVLMVVLSAIVLLNIVAIMLLGNRIQEQQQAREQSLQQQRTNDVNNANDPNGIPSGAQNTQDAQNSGSSAQQARNTIRTQPLVTTLRIIPSQSCADCYDIDKYIIALNNTIYMDVKTIPSDALKSDLGYVPPRLPALLFNATLEAYPQLLVGWNNSGTVITIPSGTYAGMWYVLPVLHAPYYDTNDSTVKGRVNVTYLTMSGCTKCVPTTVLRDALTTIDITPYHEENVDVNSTRGRMLVREYNITRVPTLLMSKDAVYHTQLFPGWYAAGTIEKDGTFVLRQLDRMRVTYYDLKYDELMVP